MNYHINNNSSNSSTIIECSMNIKYTTASLYIFCPLISLIGNFVIILSINRVKLLRFGGYYTLAHYAFLDVIFSTISLIFILWTILFHRSEILELIFNFGFIGLGMSRKMFILFMALTKFYCVAFPMNARRIMCLSWYKKVIGLVWIFGITLSIPMVILQKFVFDRCTYSWILKDGSSSFTWIYGLIINSVVTLVIIIVYPYCFWKIRKTSVHWERRLSSGRYCQSNTVNSERKILFLFFIDACVFVFCWSPFYLFQFLDFSNSIKRILHKFFRCAQLAYSPFLYVCFNSHIRRGVMVLFRIRSENPSRPSSSNKAYGEITV